MKVKGENESESARRDCQHGVRVRAVKEYMYGVPHRKLHEADKIAAGGTRTRSCRTANARNIGLEMTRQTKIRDDLEDTDSEEEGDESKTRQERKSQKRKQQDRKVSETTKAPETESERRKHEEVEKEKEKQRSGEAEETGTSKRSNLQRANHPVGGGKPAERCDSGAAEQMAEQTEESSDEGEGGRKKKRRRLRTKKEQGTQQQSVVSVSPIKEYIQSMMMKRAWYRYISMCSQCPWLAPAQRGGRRRTETAYLLARLERS